MFRDRAAQTAAENPIGNAGGAAATDLLVIDRADVPAPNGNGAGRSAPEPLDPIICECAQVSFRTLKACIKAGADTQEELARQTGATTNCGSCAPRVAQILGAPSGYLTRITEVRDLLPNVRSYRFTSDAEQAAPVLLPGQHVVLSAVIGGEWVSRPYTLTSPAGHPVQEITVKKEDGGVFSRWLFEQRPDGSDWIQVTPPRGNFCIDLARREPIVFLAGGIGITPAISLARTFASHGGHLVHIDYSARDAEGFAFREELRELATWCEGITTRFRVTSRGERLTQEDVRDLRWRFPRGRFFLCGPSSYQASVQEYLQAAGVEPNRVHVEVFSIGPTRPTQNGQNGNGQNGNGQTANGQNANGQNANGQNASGQDRQNGPNGRNEQDGPTGENHPSPAPAKPAPTTRAARRFPNLGSQVLAATLLLLYLAQGIFGWEWPWLESLQEVESYRRWSGGVLLAYIAVQWVLPALRVSAVDFRAVRFAYRWHRRAGGLSPIFFYAHATWLGAGYLAALASVYLANVAVGIWDKTIISDLAARERYARFWMLPHVALACLTVGLTLVHIFIVFAFK